MHNLNTVHGNLTTDTIFLQHHGLLKIGCFSITTMRSYVKTNAEENNHIKVTDEQNRKIRENFFFRIQYIFLMKNKGRNLIFTPLASLHLKC